MNNVLPRFKDTTGTTWEVISMDWCIDFGGRQCQLECQTETTSGTYPTKTFVVYALTGEFTQWDSNEYRTTTPEPNSKLHHHIMNMFRTFDETCDPDFQVASNG